jgi:hypothetical protein
VEELVIKIKMPVFARPDIFHSEMEDLLMRIARAVGTRGAPLPVVVADRAGIERASLEWK